MLGNTEARRAILDYKPKSWRDCLAMLTVTITEAPESQYCDYLFKTTVLDFIKQVSDITSRSEFDLIVCMFRNCNLRRLEIHAEKHIVLVLAGDSIWQWYPNNAPETRDVLRFLCQKGHSLADINFHKVFPIMKAGSTAHDIAQRLRKFRTDQTDWNRNNRLNLSNDPDDPMSFIEVMLIVAWGANDVINSDKKLIKPGSPDYRKATQQPSAAEASLRHVTHCTYYSIRQDDHPDMAI